MRISVLFCVLLAACGSSSSNDPGGDGNHSDNDSATGSDSDPVSHDDDQPGGDGTVPTGGDVEGHLGSWGTATLVQADETSATTTWTPAFPDIAVNDAGFAIAAWNRVVTPLGAGTTTYEVWGSSYAPGTGWTTPTRIDGDTPHYAGFLQPHVAINVHGDGVVSCARRTVTDILTRKYVNIIPFSHTTGFATPVVPYGVDDPDHLTDDIAIADNGRIALVWRQALGLDAEHQGIYGGSYTEASGWSEKVKLQSSPLVDQDGSPYSGVPPRSNTQAVVRITADGRALGVWSDLSSGEVRAAHLPAGGVWSTYETVGQQILPPPSNEQDQPFYTYGYILPAAEIDAQGNAVVIVTASDGGVKAGAAHAWLRVFRYSVNTGFTQLADLVAPNAAPSSSFSPQLVVHADGSASVAFASTTDTVAGKVWVARAAAGTGFGEPTLVSTLFTGYDVPRFYYGEAPDGRATLVNIAIADDGYHVAFVGRDFDGTTWTTPHSIDAPAPEDSASGGTAALEAPNSAMACATLGNCALIWPRLKEVYANQTMDD